MHEMPGDPAGFGPVLPASAARGDGEGARCVPTMTGDHRPPARSAARRRRGGPRRLHRRRRSDIEVAQVGRATVTEVVEARRPSPRGRPRRELAGRRHVAELRVRDGEQVRAGQVLLRVESPSARRALRQALRRRRAGGVGRDRAGRPATLAGAAQADATAQPARSTAARAAARRIPDPAGAGPGARGARRSRRRSTTRPAPRPTRPPPSWPPASAALSDAVAALSSAQRVQTRAAVEVARRTVAALVVRAPIAGTVSLSPRPRGPRAPAAAGDLLSQLPESLQSQAGAALGGVRRRRHGHLDRSPRARRSARGQQLLRSPTRRRCR